MTANRSSKASARECRGLCSCPLPSGLWGCLPMPPACCRTVTVATPRGCGRKGVDQTGLWGNCSFRDPWGCAKRAAKNSHSGREEHKNRQSKNMWYFLRILSKYPTVCSSDVSRCSPLDLKAFHAFSSCKFACWFFEPHHLLSRDVVSPIQCSLHAFVSLCTFPGSSIPLQTRAQEHVVGWWSVEAPLSLASYS